MPKRVLVMANSIGAESKDRFRYDRIMAGGLPVLLSVRGRRVVIVGGGQVAARKARAALDAGAASVVVVSPQTRASLPDGVERIAMEFEPGFLDGAWLALACTDDERVNDRVVQAARLRGILVARADVSWSDPGDFTMMAVHRCPPIVLACSGGGAPGIAQQALRRASAAIGSDLVSLASLLQDLRPAIRSSLASAPHLRRRLLAWLGSEDATAVYAAGGVEALMDQTFERFHWPSDRAARRARS